MFDFLILFLVATVIVIILSFVIQIVSGIIYIWVICFVGFWGLVIIFCTCGAIKDAIDNHKRKKKR